MGASLSPYDSCRDECTSCRDESTFCGAGEDEAEGDFRGRTPRELSEAMTPIPYYAAIHERPDPVSEDASPLMKLAMKETPAETASLQSTLQRGMQDNIQHRRASEPSLMRQPPLWGSIQMPATQQPGLVGDLGPQMGGTPGNPFYRGQSSALRMSASPGPRRTNDPNPTLAKPGLAFAQNSFIPPTTAQISPTGTPDLSTFRDGSSYGSSPAPVTQLTLGSQSSLAQDVQARPNLAELVKDHRQLLKSHVKQCFKLVAQDSKQIDRPGLQQLQRLLSARLGVPAEAFGNKEVDFERFDFSGDGYLNVQESYKMAKFNLYEHCIRRGLIPTITNIAVRDLSSAGYTIVRTLGRGAQGSAMLANDRQGEEVCIKCYPKTKLKASGVESLLQEFEALKLLDSEVIAGAVEMFQDANNYYMVGEVYLGGDFNTIRQRAIAEGVTLDEPWWRFVFAQCLEGIAFMHDQAMIHCDIKEPNLMVKTDDFDYPEVVIIDLGVATCMAKAEKGVAGTPGYVPPETLETLTWFPRGDLFSMGVVMMQMLCDKVPFEKNGRTYGGIFIEGCSSTQEIFTATRTRPAPLELMPTDQPYLIALVESLLQKRREHRPTARQALEDPWIGKKGGAFEAFSPKARNAFATRGITMCKTLSNIVGERAPSSP